MEPGLKPAVAISSTRYIAVMATRSTLVSARFAALLAGLAGQDHFVLLPCDGLAEAIEKTAQCLSDTKIIAACAQIIWATGTFNSQKESGNASKPYDTLV